MLRPSLALLILCLICAVAHGQSLARQNRDNAKVIEDATADQVVAAQAILLLKRLDDDVIFYNSLREFEESRQLARVSFETFQQDLNEVRPEVEDLVARLPNGRLKTELSKALVSYLDGAYWWERVLQRRTIKLSDLRSGETDATSDSLFRANLLYTVIVHWRQANQHLQDVIRHFQ